MIIVFFFSAVVAEECKKIFPEQGRLLGRPKAQKGPKLTVFGVNN